MIIHNPILTGSFTVNGTNVASITSSADSITALNNYTASQNNRNGTYATTGSNTFAGIQTVNSNLVVTGSITAQTLVVQTITSSVDFVTGSTRFGSILSNTHVFSGSVTMNPGGLFVSSSGNVGIGTTSPVNLLDVVKAGTNAIRVQNTTNASDAYYIAQNTSGSAFFGINSTGPYIYTLEALSLQVITNNTERLRVTSAGNVGIGTNAPTSILDIGGASGNPTFRLNGATSSSPTIRYDQNGVAKAWIYLTSGGTLQINTTASDGQGIAINSSNNVGIGNSLGYNALDVKGVGTSTTNLEGIAGFYKNTAKGGALVIRTHDTVADIAATWYNASTNIDLTFSTVPTDGTYYERMRITSGGNVIIRRPSSGTTILQLQGVDAYGDTSTLQLCNGRSYIRSTILVSANGDTDITFGTQSGGSVAERMKITSAGQLQITQAGNGYPDGLRLTNTNAAYWIMVNGGDNNLYLGYNASDRGQFNNSTGAYTALSDINKKKDFEESTIGLDAILGLKPTLYRMKVEENTDKHLGFIAQEVKEFIPQAYVESGQESNKFIGLDYQAITATLVKAIQEQQAQIDELKSLINK